jgi:hypothetical protein
MRRTVAIGALAVTVGLALLAGPVFSQQVNPRSNPEMDLPRPPTSYGPYTPYLPPHRYMTPQQSRQYLPGQPNRQDLLQQQSYQNLAGQQNRQYVPSGVRGAPSGEGQVQPHVAIQPFPQPVPPRTTGLGGVPQAPRALPSKPFSDYRPPPVMSPYMNLYRRDLDFDAAYNYYTLVQPFLTQQALNQRQIYTNAQLAGDLRQVQTLTATNARFLDAAQPLIEDLPGAGDYPTVQSFPGYGASGRYLSYGNYYMNLGGYYPSFRQPGRQ